MKILILDDDDMRHSYFAEQLAGHDVVHAHTYDEFCDALDNADRFDVVFLDHDLNDHRYRSTMIGASLYGGTQELDGQDAAYYMANRLPIDRRPIQTIVHSWNPDGGARIVDILRQAGFSKVVRWEFDPAVKLNVKE